MEPLKTSVIIMGAGPTGLSLAAQLLRYGVDFLLFDKKEDVTNLSKAVVVHARTLEIYDQMGLAQTAVEEGEIVQQMALLHDGDIRVRLDFSNLGGNLSPFPFLLMFEQSKNERLLNAHLQSAGLTVRWRMEMESLTQEEAGVKAVLKAANGETQTVEARYLVGCDGASSATRHQLGLGFEGSTFPRLFYVADVDMEFVADPHCVYASFGTNAFALLFPMKGEKHWRLIGNLPEYEDALKANPDQVGDIPFEIMESKVKSLIQRPLDITNVRWFSSYKVHTRHAETFRKGRCFLAGDAAHVHTPAGGQGMNTGIQDAYNLAWKLALTLRGEGNDALLETYNEERMANAKRLLKTTDRLFDVAADDHWYTQFFRDHVLPSLAGLVTRFEAAKEVVFPTISQIGIHYRESALSRHEGDADFKIKAGDRLPYFQADGAGIYDKLQAPKFHLLAAADSEADCQTLQSEVEREYSDLVDFVFVRLTPPIQELFGAKQSFMLLLRPDNHIALISPEFPLKRSKIISRLQSAISLSTPECLLTSRAEVSLPGAARLS